MIQAQLRGLPSWAPRGVMADKVCVNQRSMGLMEKLNPQPEPPSFALDLFGWIVYLIRLVFWAITIPFQRG